jgi:hypothetical protein
MMRIYCAQHSERNTPEAVRAKREAVMRVYLEEKFLELYVQPVIGTIPYYQIIHITKPFWKGVVKHGINDALKDLKCKVWKDVFVGKNRVRFKIVGYGESILTSK